MIVPRMPRWIILAILLLVVLARSAVFVLSPESYFDADQAVFGLMAKHLAEGRAFPIFMYGQSYILAVEAWMAAPVFLLAGVSATALKLPLFALNPVIAWLLFRTFEREMGLRPVAAAVASLPFALPSVAMAAVFVEPSGGNLEPYLYVLLLWLTRHRPLWCGVILGVGFLHREFTIYGLAALLAIEAFDRTLFTRAGLALRGAMAGAAAVIWLAVQVLKRFSSGSGPGTSFDSIYGASNNILELAARTCVSPSTALTGSARLMSIHWPALLGTAPYPLRAFSIESTGSQGLAWSSWLPLLVVLLAAAGIARAAISRQDPRPAPRFAVYLVLVGAFSSAGYVFGRCGEVSFYAMRYELLSILAIAGIVGWFLRGPVPRPLMIAWSTVFAAWLAILAVPHLRLAAEYATHPPIPAKRQLIRVLENRGVRYGTADYWIAYYVDFMTRERIILASDEPQRIKTYNALVAEHAGEAIRLSRRRCEGGILLIPGVYQCP
jgi:hypothetical protein